MFSEPLEDTSKDVSHSRLQLLEALVEHATDGLMAHDAEGRMLYCNPALAGTFHLSPRQFLSTDSTTLWGEATSLQFTSHREEVLRSGVSIKREYEISGGAVYYIAEVTVSPYRDGFGNLLGVVSAFRALTKKRIIQNKFSQQQRFLEGIASGVPLHELLAELVSRIDQSQPGTISSFMLLTRDGKRLQCGATGQLPRQYCEQVDGVEVGPEVGSCGAAVCRGEPVFVADIANDSLWTNYRNLALSHGLRACWSMPIRSRVSTSRNVLGTFAIYSNRCGLPDPMLMELIQDVEYCACIAIESVRARQDLQASEARFRTFVENSYDAFYLHDRQGRILDVNQVACNLLGYSREELIGKMPREIDPMITEEQLAEILAFSETGQTMVFETRHRRKDGYEFPVEMRLSPFWQEGKPFLVANTHDITERKKAECELKRANDLLNAVASGTTDAIFVKDRDGKYLMFNEAAAKFVGKPINMVVGKDDTEVFEPQSAQTIRERDLRIMEKGIVETCEETLVADGVARTYQATKGPYRDGEGNIIGLFGVSRDVTELKGLEEQIRQSQKMDAIGRLAGGVAHDFNNILTVINGYSELLLQSAKENGPQTEFLRAIRDAGERAAGLTAQLLSFSRKAIVEPKTFDLNHVVDSMTQMLKRLIAADVHFDVSPCASPMVIRADIGQIQQVIMNLVVNARDATPAGGSILVMVDRLTIEQNLDNSSLNLRAGQYARLRVKDTGHGILQENLTRIFDPFFSTKGPEKGTGLGLSVVHGIVMQWGGHIAVDSTPNVETVFTLCFPIVDEEPSEVMKPRTRTIQRGSESLLLVEDATLVRNMTRTLLEMHGFEVFEAANGTEALQILDEAKPSIRLLLTDLVLPGMHGQQLAELALQKHPHLKVLYMSGYAEDASLQFDTLEAHKRFIAKPFTPAALVNRIRQALDGDL